MMIALFTLVSLATASYQGYPSLQTHQAGHQAGGAGANPFAPYLAMLDQILPGLGSNPMQYYMYGDAFDGDVKDVAKKVMKGDVFEAMDKVTDLDYYPYMAMQQMKKSTTGGAGGAASTGGAPKMPSWYWMMADLQKPVNPVAARLQATRADPATTGTTPSATSGFPFFPPFALAQNFMNTFLPGLSTNPMAYYFYDNVMDADVEEAMEKAMKGDYSEALDKLDYFDDYFPFMMPYAQSMFGGKSTGGSTGGSASASPFMPYMMYDMFDLAKAKPSSVKPKTYIQPVVYPNGQVRYFPVSPVNERLQKTN